MRQASFLDIFLDPTCVFALSCFFSILFVKGVEEKQELVIDIPSWEKVYEALTCHLYLAVYAYLAFVILLTFSDVKRNNLSIFDVRLASWFLWSATIFHVALDCGGGLFQQPKVLRDTYHLLDIRFRSDIPFSRGGPHISEVHASRTGLLLELFVQNPLCILSYFAIMKKKPYRHELALITLSTHVFGTFMFLLPALLDECKGMPPIGEPGCFPPLTLYNYFYFYFGVGANVVWIFVPCLFMYYVIDECIMLKSMKVKMK